MKGRNKILLGGVLLAAAIVIVGVSGRLYYAYRLSGLVAECETHNVPEPRPYNYDAGPSLCDPAMIYARGTGAYGIQGEIQTAYLDSKIFMSGFPIAAGSIALLFAVPWLWYFFLRRLAELRRAGRGAEDEP
jgi:hypothetical protein